MKQLKKPLLIFLIVVCAFALLAVIVGVLNATVGGGEWMLGWQDYRYENGKDYQAGGATVYSEEIKSLEVDWIKGSVSVFVVEDDRYLSLSEESEDAITEKGRARWYLGENGKLTVKFRESAFFFATGIKQKQLVIRIPAAMASQLEQVTVNGKSCLISLRGLESESVTVSTERGSVTVSDCLCGALTVSTGRGDISASGSFTQAVTLTSERGSAELAVPEDASMSILFRSRKGSMISELPLREENGRQICGEGACAVTVDLKNGDMKLIKKQ
ncbi:MAG: hypothetical protein E7620_05010 [Ruminococcaceae bacterium]|nr:hypothetical protein [Oscillospiraceae bacterium]